MGRRARVVLEIDLEEMDDADISNFRELAQFLDDDGVEEIQFHAFETSEYGQEEVAE